MSKSRNRNLAELIDGTGAGASSLAVYATKENLPTTGLTSGDQAYVSNTSRFYISNGSGWYNVALVNATPALTISPTGEIVLSTDGSTTTITLTGTDSDNAVAGLTFSVESDGSFNGFATLSQDSSVFTITPRSEDSATTTSSTLTFKASDGISFGSDTRVLSLQFSVQYSRYTSMLLVADSDGTDTQVDASSTGTTLTEVGSVPSTPFTPYHPGGYSVYFDGTGDWLTVANGSEQMVPEAGDFTVEFWFYTTNASTRMDPYSSYTSTTGFGIILNYSSGGTVTTYKGNTLTNQSSGGQFSSYTWNHLAVSRSGTTTKIFINGTAIHTNASDSTDYSGTSTLYIGAAGNQSNPYTGYLTDVRFVKGTAVYTSNFTAPTKRLTAIANTKLLACHLSYFADGSTDNNTITLAGNTRVYRFGPYDYEPYTVAGHGGSIDFNNDVNNSYRLDGIAAYGTNDFTLEFWFWAETTSSNVTLFDARPTNGNGAYITIAHNSSDGIGLYANTGWRIQSNVLKPNVWTHIALSRVSGTSTFYVNGKSIGTYSDSINYIAGSSRPLVGRNGYGATSQVDGFYSDLRSVKGSAVYTTNFTPPTSPLTDVTNTEVLTFTNKNSMYTSAHFDGPTILSSGVSASTGQRKFTTTDSFYFNGSNSYLQVSDVLTTFGTRDFTIEAWVYMNSVTGSRNIYDGRGSGTQNIPTLYVSSSTLYYYTAGSNRITGGSLSADTWYHIAVARTGTSTKMFVNGTQVGSTYSDSTNYIRDSVARSAYWGNYAGNLGGDYIGYMQNMRITWGFCRYTGNFTAPTAGFDG